MPIVNGLGVLRKQGDSFEVLELGDRQILEPLQGPLSEAISGALKSSSHQIVSGEWGGSLIRVYRISEHSSFPRICALWMHEGEPGSSTKIGIFHRESGWMEVNDNGVLSVLTDEDRLMILNERRNWFDVTVTCGPISNGRGEIISPQQPATAFIVEGMKRLEMEEYPDILVLWCLTSTT